MYETNIGIPIMTYPKISVIVPVYNIEKYIQTAVESLVNQTYKNIEIILVDDGSTDSSPQICDRLENLYPNVKTIHQDNRGVSAARNTGVNAASGEYIGFCDGDDIADRDMYQFLYELSVSDKADISMCELRFAFDDGSIRNIATGEHKIWNNCEEFLCDFFKGKINLGTYTKLFKAEICREIEYPEDRKINEDKYYCYLAALKSDKICMKSEAKYTYFRRESSSSITKFSEKYLDILYIADMILENTIKTHPAIEDNARCNKLSSVLRLYKLMYMRGGLESFKEQADELVKYVRHFDYKIAKKYLSKNDFIRFKTLRMSKKLFFFMIDHFDKL